MVESAWLSYSILFLGLVAANWTSDRFLLRRQLKRLERAYKEKISSLDVQVQDLKQLVETLHTLQSAAERIEELTKSWADEL